jgi:hypothetical protein
MFTYLTRDKQGLGTNETLPVFGHSSLCGCSGLGSWHKLEAPQSTVIVPNVLQVFMHL